MERGPDDEEEENDDGEEELMDDALLKAKTEMNRTIIHRYAIDQNFELMEMTIDKIIAKTKAREGPRAGGRMNTDGQDEELE